MIGYIYRITIINKESKLQGKNYIGLHLSKNFDNQYFGSGRIIKDYRKKHGQKGLHKDLMSEEKYKSMLKNRSIAMTGKLVGEKNPSFNKNVKDSDIIKLKNEGCSINEISEKLECNYSLVYARLKNLNIDTNKKIVNKEEVKDLLNKGCSVKETSKLLKCTESRIYQIKRELKI